MLIGKKEFIFHNGDRKITTWFHYPIDEEKLDLKKYKTEKNNYYGFTFVENAPLKKVNSNLMISISGTGGGLMSSAWLYKDLIKNNFFILSVNREGNSFTTRDPIKYVEQWQFPEDVSVCLSQFLEKETISKYVINIFLWGFLLEVLLDYIWPEL